MAVYLLGLKRQMSVVGYPLPARRMAVLIRHDAAPPILDDHHYVIDFASAWLIENTTFRMKR